MQHHWIDSHCHLHYGGLSEKLNSILQEAEENNLKYMLCVSTEIEDYKKIASFIENDSIYQSIGIHPLSSVKYSVDEINNYLNNVTNLPKVIAVGETGLDDFRSPLDPKQIEAFAAHAQYAMNQDLPIIMHTRNGPDSVVESEAKKIISSYKVRGVAHCFGGSMDFAEFLLDHGWYISFAGNLTYKNAHSLREVAIKVPMERILIETDAPFLSPEGYRGTENTPLRVIEVAKKLSEIKDIGLDEVQKHTYENFRELFKV